VDAVGSEVKKFKKDDAVFYMAEVFPSKISSPFKGRAYAEYHITDASFVTHKPKDLTFLEAAALPL
jgi:NADPH:quinone reductase-like Zn-dependent oxidoreductase